MYGAWITVAVRHLAKHRCRAYKLPLSNGRTVTPFTQAIADGAAARWGPITSTLDSIAFLQYTGGTTGLSKGAVLTHRNIVAATLQAEAWFTPALARAGDLREGQQHRGAAAVSHLRADAAACWRSARART